MNTPQPPAPDWLTFNILKYGFSVLAFVVIILGFRIVTQWPAVRLFLSDVVGGIGFLGRWLRKIKVESEFESSINGFTSAFNSRIAKAVLPECKIKWVKPNEAQTYLENGRTIVCLSFDRRNHDKNFFLATRQFVGSAFLTRTKDYVRKNMREGLDLLMTRKVLLNARRTALNIFNMTFAEESNDSKEAYYVLEEIDRNGFFQQLLVPELFSYGEEVLDRAPDERHKNEIDALIIWMHNIAVREERARSELAFHSDHIRTAVLLVADTEHYSKYGLEPYLRRAESYAAQRFGSFYVVARGFGKVGLANKIASDLQRTGNYEIIGHKHETTIFDEKNVPILITIIPIRPLTDRIINQAWETAVQCQLTKRPITVAIEQVLPDSLKVNFRGLHIRIHEDDLSEYGKIDPTRFFAAHSEIDVLVVEANRNLDFMRLSNRGTRTDPKTIVETTGISPGKVVDVIIVRQIEKAGYAVALAGEIPNTNYGVFLPRRNVTYSRFTSLSKLYPIGQHVQIEIESFDHLHANFVGKIPLLIDPWARPLPVNVNDITRVQIHEVTDYQILTEVVPGVEGLLHITELSWNGIEEGRKQIKEYHIGDQITVRCMAIDEGRRQVLMSLKRVAASDEELFFHAHMNEVEDAVVSKIDSFGVYVLAGTERVRGYVPLREISWTYCERPEVILPVGSTHRFCVLAYDQERNTVGLSLKRASPNRFKEFMKAHKVGELVVGRVARITDKLIQIDISYEGQFCVAGFVRFAEVSHAAYVDAALAGKIFENGKSYKFAVKESDADREVVQLSRKMMFLSSRFTPSYGEVYEGRAGFDARNRLWLFYSDQFEARMISRPRFQSRDASSLSVIVARLADSQGVVEVDNA